MSVLAVAKRCIRTFFGTAVRNEKDLRTYVPGYKGRDKVAIETRPLRTGINIGGVNVEVPDFRNYSRVMGSILRQDFKCPSDDGRKGAISTTGAIEEGDDVSTVKNFGRAALDPEKEANWFGPSSEARHFLSMCLIVLYEVRFLMALVVVLYSCSYVIYLLVSAPA